MMILLAKLFAKWAHRKQKRKYTGEPYYTHCHEVASYVRHVPHTRHMIAAAYLHDVVEDTGYSLKTIRLIFGKRVAYLVDGLTDVSKPGDGNRAVRKKLDREHTAGFDGDVHTIKLCDLISNSISITEHDPSFAKTYMVEKEELLKVLTKGNPSLQRQAKDIIDRYKRLIEEENGTPI